MSVYGNAPDSIAIVREFLVQSGSALYTLVGTRIDTIGNYDNSQPFIIMNRRGGIEPDRAPYSNPSIQFKCYSGTGRLKDNRVGPKAASAVALALDDKLNNAKNEKLTSGTLMSAYIQQPPQDLIDPEREYPFVLVFYDVRTNSST